jgi:hypothetical protein
MVKIKVMIRTRPSQRLILGLEIVLRLALVLTLGLD